MLSAHGQSSDCLYHPNVYTCGDRETLAQGDEMSDNRSGGDRPMQLLGSTRPVFVLGAGFLIGFMVGLSIGISAF